MSYVIETKNLSKKYPVLKRYRDVFLHPFKKKYVQALHDVSIQVEKGEIFGLLGPNGAGKSTLIKILCTLVLPTAGRALISGLDVAKDGRAIRKNIGYVLGDERSFYWRLTGRQNLVFFAKLNNLSSANAGKRIKELLHELELERYADRLFKDYSTGMRKKLAIARGLLTNPDIVFMDEPTSGLDPVTAHNFKSLIRSKLVEEGGRTVIFATHNLQEAEAICNHVAIIQDGKIKASGTINEMKKGIHRNRRYVIRLKDPHDSILEKIRNIYTVNVIIREQENVITNYTHIEIQDNGKNGDISSVIRDIVNMGGELHSFYEKEVSLQELFSEIVSAEAQK